ncbi:hypothetical protein DPMN_146479 [Dreissena polymorpha]|uniref:Uncharacterized protein n=1 Tax=Dreissena polymorpha TaxID=45954 RepID=A0A9D4FBU2_DREPO|nr:hypothetical protein DPMN_146479 [Dreissena polymorpha]
MENFQLFSLPLLWDGNNNDTSGEFNKSDYTQLVVLRQVSTLTSEAIIRTMNQS